MLILSGKAAGSRIKRRVNAVVIRVLVLTGLTIPLALLPFQPRIRISSHLISFSESFLSRSSRKSKEDDELVDEEKEKDDKEDEEEEVDDDDDEDKDEGGKAVPRRRGVDLVVAVFARRRRDLGAEDGPSVSRRTGSIFRAPLSDTN
ncbi:hypothetical protein M0802_005293 [Mischocyttarus mexicanus]|nr:hypothetical protein M0802_005293 [Mischocyttarus mexicanus]